MTFRGAPDNLAESHPNPIIPGGEWHRGEGAVAVRAGGGGGGRHPTPRDADEVCEEVERPLAVEKRRLPLQPHLGPGPRRPRRRHLGSKKRPLHIEKDVARGRRAAASAHYTTITDSPHVGKGPAPLP